MGSSSEYASRRASHPALPLPCASSRSVRLRACTKFSSSLPNHWHDGLHLRPPCARRRRVFADSIHTTDTTRPTLQPLRWAEWCHGGRHRDTYRDGRRSLEPSATPRAHRTPSPRMASRRTVLNYTHVLLTSYAHLDSPPDEAHAHAAGRRQRHAGLDGRRKARDGPQLIFIKNLAQEDSRFEQS